MHTDGRCFTDAPFLVFVHARGPDAGPANRGRRAGPGAQAPALEAVVQASHQAGRFDGVVLVARNGKILCGVGEGLADREKKTPNTLDTPFPLCSITKQFTALPVMQLVQAGKVRLAGVVTDYLPDFRADTGGKITVKDLLTHTSGLPSPDDALPEKGGVPGSYIQTEPKFVNAGYVVKTYLQGDLKTAPGEKFNYNSGDYLVLQAILEKVTGKSYARLLQERVLGPLGMTHTGLIGPDAYAPRQAVGYVQEGGKLVREPYSHLATFGAAGTMYSTARDMLRWDDALGNTDAADLSATHMQKGLGCDLLRALYAPEH